ncbi:hypothetical protein GQX74_009689 [Glossina fuscipes]|nr:hypothetical protein GQX74_009689 [Glossina fuscipes]
MFNYAIKGGRPYKAVLFGLDKQKLSIIKTHLISMDLEDLEKKGFRSIAAHCQVNTSRGRSVRRRNTAGCKVYTIKYANLRQNNVHVEKLTSRRSAYLLSTITVQARDRERFCKQQQHLLANLFAVEEIKRRTFEFINSVKNYKANADQFEVITSLAMFQTWPNPDLSLSHCEFHVYEIGTLSSRGGIVRKNLPHTPNY